ncbi:hypothetical protein, partial [Xanthomonas oryzae]|uniref:hypothetical protein n=1 Tax=Xanthomonas oryzae TaxID=347 RepID=UPI000CC6700E
ASFGRLALVGNSNHDAPSVLAKERDLRKRTPHDRPTHSTCMASLVAQEHGLQAAASTLDRNTNGCEVVQAT